VPRAPADGARAGRAGSGPPASVRRAELLAGAARAFERHGYAGTSLRLVADEADILPGSLYHHFDSKESIAVELVENLQRELAAVVERFAAEPGGDLGTLRALARATAALSDRHRAAVALCLYEAPTSASSRLTDLLRARPLGDEASWRRLIDGAARSGALRLPDADTDLVRLAFLETAWTIGVVAQDAPAADLADACAEILLRGLRTDRRAALPGSTGPEPVLAAVAQHWAEQADGDGSRRGELLDTARDEFARRGFEATTMRDIAEAAGTPVASLYRQFRSKEELLAEIVHRFSGPLLDGFRDVVAAADGPVQALDGLIGLMALAGSVFSREYDIVKTWWRVVTPEPPGNAADEHRERFTILRDVLAAGVAEGSFRRVADGELGAVCVRELLWVPYDRVCADPQRVRDFLRRTVLWGAAA
jgi:AcrR family transcriptional regulator